MYIGGSNFNPHTNGDDYQQYLLTEISVEKQYTIFRLTLNILSPLSHRQYKVKEAALNILSMVRILVLYSCTEIVLFTMNCANNKLSSKSFSIKSNPLLLAIRSFRFFTPNILFYNDKLGRNFDESETLKNGKYDSMVNKKPSLFRSFNGFHQFL